MAILFSTPCSASGHKGKKTATRMISFEDGIKLYGICEDCFLWFKKIRQLVIKDYPIKKEKPKKRLSRLAEHLITDFNMTSNEWIESAKKK